MPRPDARSVTAAVRAEEASPLDDLLFGAEPPAAQSRPVRRSRPAAPPRAPEPDRTVAPEPVPSEPATVPPSTAPAGVALTPAATAVAAVEVRPATLRSSYGRSRFFQLTVPLPLETHAALRDAAVARGSIREMSIIVREAIDAYLRHVEAMGEAERQATVTEAAAALSAARARGRRDVAYRLEEDQRARLLPFSGAQGIPMSAIAAAAIRAALPPTG